MKNNLKPLTKRQTEVVFLIAKRGLSNKEIAELLKIGVKSVESHRAKAMRKLSVRRTAELCLYVYRHPKVIDHSLVSEFSAGRRSDFTPCELEVLQGIKRNLKNSEIARLRGTALQTIKNHVRTLFIKTGCLSRQDLREKLSSFGL
jgi:DNA-binding NarL/FixJ family response regulator